MNEHQFARIALRLLEGQIIDDVRYPEDHAFLQNDHQRSELNQHLARLERHCQATLDGSGYYCTHSEAAQAQSNVRRQFNEWVRDIEPLTEWLRLCRVIESDARPLNTGDTLNQSELLAAIEPSGHLQQQLRDIATRLTNTNSTSKPKVHLDSVLTWLEKNHYLHPLGGSGAVYRATAKWALFYEQLEYITACDNIDNQPTTELEQDQQKLL